jgi:hypothetical protein
MVLMQTFEKKKRRKTMKNWTRTETKGGKKGQEFFLRRRSRRKRR